MHRRPTRYLASAFLAAGVLLIAGSASAAILTLQNDSFVDGAAAGFQQGFVSGEAAAVTLGPVNEAFKVRKIQLLFGGGGSTKDVTVRVYADDAGTTDPGALLFEADYTLQAADDALQEIDLTGENIAHGAGSIRVSVLFSHTSFPSVARDDDGIKAKRNWIWTQGTWLESGMLGLAGDWIVRAEVETTGSQGTGGSGGQGAGGQGQGGQGTAGQGEGGQGTGGQGTAGQGTGGAGTGGQSAAGQAGAPAAGGASGSGGGQLLCTPGQSIQCFGPGACQGGQACLSTGLGYGPCECANPPAAADSGDDGGCAVASESDSAPLSPALLALGAAVCVLARRRRRS